MCNSINKKKKKKHDKIVLLAETKLNTIEVLISKDLIDSNISHNEFLSVNNVLNKLCYRRPIYFHLMNTKRIIK